MQQSLTPGLKGAHMSFMQFRRKEVLLWGPPTANLLDSGKIKTAVPCCVRRIEAATTGKKVLFVLIPITDVEKDEKFEGMNLRVPTMGEVIRFASQVEGNDVTKNAGTIVFPHEPPFEEGTIPPAPSWLTLVPREGTPELVLFQIDRQRWPEKCSFAAVSNTEV